MKCDRAQEFFSDYLERTLDRPMAVALEGHLQECNACREDLEFLGEAVRSLSLVPEVEPPVNGDQEVIWTLRRLHEQRLQAERNRPTFLGWLQSFGPARLGFAAGLATLIVAGSWIGIKTNSGQAGFGGKIGSPTIAPQRVADLKLQVIYGDSGAGGQAVTFRLTPNTSVPDLTVSLNGDGLETPYVAPATGPIEAGKDVDLPLTVAGTSGAQVFRVKAASIALRMEREFVIAVPLGKHELKPVTLALSYQTLDGALKQLGEFVDRPIVADGTLTGPVKLQLQSSRPNEALEVLAAQLGGRLQATDEAYLLTAR